MLLRADTPSLICDVDQRLRGSIRESGANVIRAVDASLVFVVAGNDAVDCNRRMDQIRLSHQKIMVRQSDGLGCRHVRHRGSQTVHMRSLRESV